MGKFRIYQSSRTNCIYYILQEVGAERKVSISGPLTLISVALQERLKEIKSKYGKVSLGDTTVDMVRSLSSFIFIFLCYKYQGKHVSRVTLGRCILSST